MNYKYLYTSSQTKFNDAKNLNNLRLNIYFLKKVSLILPAHNEEGNIRPIYEEITRCMGQTNYDFNIIFIDDGSTDQTLPGIQSLAEIDHRVKYIELSRNFGHQYAIKAGLDHTDAEILIMMDCDLQHPPELIPMMLKEYERGYEIVRTRRKEAGHEGYLKMFNLGIRGFTSFSTKPLYFSAYLGILVSIISLLFLPYVLSALFSGHTVAGWASIMLTISFFGGLNLLVLGIIGVYLAKLFVQNKSRPHYIIRNTNL